MVNQSAITRLRSAVNAAHKHATKANKNLSSSVVQEYAFQAVPFHVAISAAILGGGGKHGPVAMAREFFFDGSNPIEKVKAQVAAGKHVPGFGNSFFKDKMDPAWDDVWDVVQKRFSQDAKLINDVRGLLNLHPNAAMFTAILAHHLNWPKGTEMAVALLPRLEVWCEQYAEAYHDAF